MGGKRSAAISVTWMGTIAALLNSSAFAAEPATGTPAPRVFAGELVETARQALRNGALSPDLAAREASLLLFWAQRLEESAGGADPATLRMAVEAARTAGKTALHRDMLRKLISVDTADYVAQVQYLDLLAANAQTIEERTRIFTAAMEQPNLATQVRSEMAVRLAQLAEERGDREASRQFLSRAVTLNDVNVPALAGLAALAAGNPRGTPEYLNSLVALVTANPLQTDAWLRLARICMAANMHDRAAEYLGVGLEQMQLAGTPGDGGLFFDYAMELAIAGRRREAATVLSSLANLQDAPLEVMLPAQLLADAAPAPASTTAPAPVHERIQARLAELARQGTERPAAWADAAGIALTILNSGGDPTIAASAAEWIDNYAKQVPADDITLQRLRGWQLLRANKLDEARTVLEKVAGTDPLASVALARVSIAQNRPADALKQLQDVWAAHPTGLLALQVLETARSANLKLEDTQWTRQLAQIASKIPANAVTAHRQPLDIQLVSGELDRPNAAPFMPLMARVRILNTTPRPLPINVIRTGSPGASQTLIGLSAELRRPEAKSLGLYGLEDVARTFRLEPRAAIETKIRVDQGALAQLSALNPTQATTATIRLYTAPMVRGDRQTVAGLGGQRVDLGDVTRLALTEAQRASLATELGANTTATEKSLMQLLVAARLIAAAPGQADAALAPAMQGAARSRDALVRAMTALAVTSGNLEEALAPLATDTDSLVRAMWARHAATVGKMGNADALQRLRQAAADEKDETVKEWMNLMVEELASAATQPAR